MLTVLRRISVSVDFLIKHTQRTRQRPLARSEPVLVLVLHFLVNETVENYHRSCPKN